MSLDDKANNELTVVAKGCLENVGVHELV